MTRYRSLVIERFGWWVRLYLGGTSKPDRSRWWRSDLSRGAYVRLRGEQVVGVQWRRSITLSGQSRAAGNVPRVEQ